MRRSHAIWIALLWVALAGAAYVLQLREALPVGSELYYNGLRHSARLFIAFSVDRLVPLVAAAGLMLAAGLLGTRTLSILGASPRDGRGGQLVAVAVGLGLVGCIVSLLGIANALIRPLFLGLLMLLLALEGRQLWKGICTLRCWRPSCPALLGEWAGAGILGVAVLWTCSLAALPPTFRDAVAHHFYIAQQFVAQGGIVRLWWVPYSDSPLFHEMLYSAAMLVGGPIAAKCLNALAGLWVIAYVHYLARSRVAPGRSALAAALASASSLFFLLATNGYADLFLCVFCLAAVECYLNWQEDERRVWIILCGLLLGFALGVKQSAAVIGALIFFGIALNPRVPARARLVNGMVLAGLAVLIVSPWCVRSYINTGNPVHPLLPGLFENEYEDYAEHGLKHAYTRFGSEETLTDYLALPWRVFMRQSYRTSRGGYGGALLSPIYLLLLPLLGVLPPNRRDERALVAFSLGYFIAWAVAMPHSIRYLSPVVPLWAALSAGLVVRIGAYSAVLGRVLSLLCVGLLLFPGVWPMLWQRARDIHYFLRPNQERELLLRMIPSLPVLEAVNEELPVGSPILSTNVDRYYCTARMYQGWTERTGKRALATADAAEAVSALRAIGIRGILFSDADQEAKWCVLVQPSNLERYFQHVLSKNGWHFWTLSSDQGHERLGKLARGVARAEEGKAIGPCT